MFSASIAYTRKEKIGFCIQNQKSINVTCFTPFGCQSSSSTIKISWFSFIPSEQLDDTSIQIEAKVNNKNTKHIIVCSKRRLCCFVLCVKRYTIKLNRDKIHRTTFPHLAPHPDAHCLRPHKGSHPKSGLFAHELVE